MYDSHSCHTVWLSSIRPASSFRCLS